LILTLLSDTRHISIFSYNDHNVLPVFAVEDDLVDERQVDIDVVIGAHHKPGRFPGFRKPDQKKDETNKIFPNYICVTIWFDESVYLYSLL